MDLYHSLPAGWLGREAGGGSEEVEENGEGGGGGGEGIEGEEVRGGSAVEEGSVSAAMCGLELHGVLQLALREIRVCQDMSAGPTFVVGSYMTCTCT